jgi:hypothetical protein
MQTCSSTTLAYAGLAIAFAVALVASLQYTGRPNIYDPAWFVEGLFGAAAIILTLNSAYYGKMAGLISSKMPDTWPNPNSRHHPKDILSRLDEAYHNETNPTPLVGHFSNVFSFWKIVAAIVMGVVIGLILACA